MFDWSKYDYDQFLSVVSENRHIYDEQMTLRAVARGEIDPSEAEGIDCLSNKEQTRRIHVIKKSMKFWPHAYGILPRGTHDGKEAYVLEFRPRPISSVCSLCNLINQIATGHRWNMGSSDLKVRIDLIFTKQEQTIPLLVCLEIRPTFDTGAYRSERHDKINLIEASKCTRLESTGQAEDSWAWLAGKLSHCVEFHDKCGKDFVEGWLPTRLLDISDLNAIKLVVTDSTISAESTRPRYATLSYKWGNASFLKLSSANMSDLLREIQVDEMPLTFRDAINASRRLNIDYLWIDSLCILQDSVQDWRKESATMDRVYGNSMVNFAASMCQTPMESFLEPVDSACWNPIKLDHSIGEENLKYTTSFDPREIAIRNSPLARRGWAIQEQVLSPRTVHFTSPLFWECREKMDSQIYSENVIDTIVPIVRNRLPKSWASMFLPNFKRPDKIQKHWECIVEQYTRSQLTKSEDKLIALSGIARIMHSNHGQTYVAGLWRHALLKGLLWYVDPETHNQSTVSVGRYNGYQGELLSSYFPSMLNSVVNSTNMVMGIH
jgi:hypothetical protein